MNNGNIETSQAEHSARLGQEFHSAVNLDELTRLKHELLRAEVRLAKARAAAAGAEVDVKVLSARLKALSK